MSEINKEALELTEKLADLLKQKGLGEISLSTDVVSVTVKAERCAPAHHFREREAFIPQEVPKTPEAPQGNLIKSPIIGTFYAAPAPDKPPFVKVGDKVEKGQVVCIIESMKLMNEVTSEFSGTVSQIYPSDGEAVEYDSSLILIV